MRFRYVKTTEVKRIPRNPGIYTFSGKEELLYIGKAGNLRGRIKNHFQEPSYRDNLFMGQVQKIGYLETGSEIEALLLESRLIKQRQPKYNVMWRDDKNYFYVAITKEEFPRVFLTHQPQRTGKYVGPFTEGKPIKLALRSLRGIFPYYVSRTHPRTLCQYCHLGLCPGPAPDKKQYHKNIRNLVAVLQGKKTSVLKTLKREMNLASRLEYYEAAGKLRDKVHALENVFSHAHLLSQGPTHERNPMRDYESVVHELKRILGRNRDIVRMEAYDISNIQGKETTGSMVVFVKGRPDKNEYRKFKIHLDGKPNDFAMMTELVSRRLSHKEWQYPDFMLIDGGKGQLSAALAAFKGHGSARSISLGALAKRNNELFLPGRKDSVLLKTMSLPLSNVLMHIRDEAHRFAISYHRKLHVKGVLLG
ncbi:MAG: GIY-YIG nuclease family protein [bacterium]|nr:GIY-YIG nuclease family protein [bacterium]